MFRGNHTAKIDDKGRLKIPSAFRTSLEEKYGTSLYVTSLDGVSARLYPMPVWEEIETRLAVMPTTDPARQIFLDRTSYFGQLAEIDGQGRVLIHPLLRDPAAMTGEVVVLGLLTYLDVWNHERFLAQRLAKPITDDVLNALSTARI
jgi:MraZ protein